MSKAEAAWAAIAPAFSFILTGLLEVLAFERTERQSKRVHLKGMEAKEREGLELCD